VKGIQNGKIILPDQILTGYTLLYTDVIVDIVPDAAVPQGTALPKQRLPPRTAAASLTLRLRAKRNKHEKTFRRSLRKVFCFHLRTGF
jgi:hypothetical protein